MECRQRVINRETTVQLTSIFGSACYLVAGTECNCVSNECGEQ